MIDLVITAVFTIIAALGGFFIKDVKAVAIFTALMATVVFLTLYLLGYPVVVLSLVGLSLAAVKISREGGKVVRRIRTYRSRRRLSKLDEVVKTLPQNIIDVVPAGSRRVIHPKIMAILSLVNEAYSKGYIVEEPNWFRDVRQYLASVGPNFAPERTKIISEYEIADLD